MPRYGPSSRIIWSLAGSNLGTAISAAGNSGAYPAGPYDQYKAAALTPVDLREANDVWLTAVVLGAVGGTASPKLTVSLNVFDDQGNLYPAVSLTAIAAINTPVAGACGVHGQGAAYIPLPAWGQVAWTVAGTSPTFTGVDISLWVR